MECQLPVLSERLCVNAISQGVNADTHGGKTMYVNLCGQLVMPQTRAVSSLQPGPETRLCPCMCDMSHVFIYIL